MSETTQPMNRQQRRHQERQLRKALSLPPKSREAGGGPEREQSALKRQPASRYLDPQEDEAYKIAVLEQFDGMAAIRNGLRKIAASAQRMGRYTNADGGRRPRNRADLPDGREANGDRPEARARAGMDPTFKVRNIFWSWKWRRNVTIWELQGKIYKSIDTESNPAALLLHTLNASDAWGIDQERHAIDTLGTLLRHRIFKQYLLTGMFMEKSERSGVHYLFRRLRPTLAITLNGKKGTGCWPRCVCTRSATTRVVGRGDVSHGRRNRAFDAYEGR